MNETRTDTVPSLTAVTHNERTVFSLLQDHNVRVSWKDEVREGLHAIFEGIAFRPILARADALHQQVLRGRVFVALHMHAGDGNVHTNIPVNSDNYTMLQEATRAVARATVSGMSCSLRSSMTWRPRAV